MVEGGCVAPVLVFLGTGGVGKTTVSLVMASWLASHGLRVRLLTVDPARRLQSVMDRLDGAAGLVSMARLDSARMMRSLIERESPDAETREAILESRFFPYLTDHLPALHEYLAADFILRDSESGDYDLVVVDTPPFEYALHFLDAPERLARLSARLGDIPLASTRRDGHGLSMMVRGLRFFLGRGFLSELMAFLESFRRLWPVLQERAERMGQLFRSHATYGLVVVPEARSIDDAVRFIEASPSWLRLSLLVGNRVMDLSSSVDLSPFALGLSSELGPESEDAPDVLAARHLLETGQAMAIRQREEIRTLADRIGRLSPVDLVWLSQGVRGITEEGRLQALVGEVERQLGGSRFLGNLTAGHPVQSF